MKKKEQNQTQKPNPTDMTLTVMAELALLRDHSLSAQDIHVRATEGIVYLTGSVLDSRHKARATRALEELDGCYGISNALAVTPRPLLEDTQAAARARQKIEHSPHLAKETTTVEVDAGRMTLRGNLRDLVERHLAVDLALSVPGVREVRSHLLVDQDAQARDARRARNAGIYFHMNPVLHGSRPRVAVANSTAVITGTVDRPGLRGLVENAVRRLCDPLIVRNELVVREQQA